MTYKPAGDERLVVSERPVPSKERIWVTELAQYLGASSAIVKRFAKKRGLLHRGSAHSAGKLYYVSVYGAQRVIAYVRALQGDEYLNGRDYHRIRQQWREQQARKLARKALKAASGPVGG